MIWELGYVQRVHLNWLIVAEQDEVERLCKIESVPTTKLLPLLRL